MRHNLEYETQRLVISLDYIRDFMTLPVGEGNCSRKFITSPIGTAIFSYLCLDYHHEQVFLILCGSQNSNNRNTVCVKIKVLEMFFFSNNIYGLDCLLVSTVSCPIVDTTGLILQVLDTFQVQMTCSTNGLSRSATKVDYQQESFP